MRSNTRVLVTVVAILFASDAVVAADGVSPPLVNWTAPRTWSPHRATGGISTMGDITGPIPFIGVTPCRQYDSRNSTKLPQNTVREVVITGAPCGIPLSAAAVSLNITVFDITGQTGAAVFQVGTDNPPTTAWINYPIGQGQIGNAGALPLSGNSSLFFRVQQGGGSIDFTIDVNGYYYQIGEFGGLTANSYFGIEGTYDVFGFGGGIIYGQNNTAPTGYGTSGVRGVYTGTQTRGAGVLGEATNTGLAVGVYGATYGVVPDGAGVLGTTGLVVTPASSLPSAGVRGEGTNGVSGITSISGEAGVRGARLTSAGFFGTGGFLAVPLYGVFALGDYGGTGAKFFIEPHPTDASKVIRYVALEGPESGTYFRGTARVAHGQAVITVPEDFRMVTDEEGLTVQLTPIGASAGMWIVTEDLNQIVVHASRDIAFHYMVNGVRRSFKDHRPIKENAEEYMPMSADARMPEGLADLQKQRLIANGTYNADGTPNLETARALGWARIWEQRLNAEPTRTRTLDPQMQQMQKK